MSQENSKTTLKGEFKLLPAVVVVLLLLLGIAGWANWYSSNVSLPRYCENPDQAMVYLEKVMNEKRPAGDEARRPYLIAAKILYLLPQHSDESSEQYLIRIREHLRWECQ